MVEEKRTLAIFERKILRKIYESVEENELWRVRRNDELETIIKGENIVRFNQMPKNTVAWAYRKDARHRNPKKRCYMESYMLKDGRGRPRMKWLDDVSMDLRKMGVSRWRDRARNREAWRRVVEEAKAHPGL
jgi:hypothetical protein